MHTARMELIAASDPQWFGRPGSPRTYYDGGSLHSFDSDPPFSIEAADILGDIGIGSPSETAGSTGVLYDGNYLGCSDAHESFASSYRARDIPWMQSMAAVIPEQQQAPLDDLDSFMAGNHASSSFQFHPPLPISVHNVEGYSIFDPSPASTDARPLDDRSSPTRRQPRIKPRLRRQNHACDPCRSSKKACDLPRGVIVRNGMAVNPCTSCETRDLDCAVSWLSRRQLVRQYDEGCIDIDRPNEPRGSVTRAKHVRPAKQAGRLEVDMLRQIPALESDLSRQAVADRACSLKFNIYIDISDSFFSQCLVQGSMPLHFKFGITAYDNLSRHALLSAHTERVERWVASCWKGCAVETILPLPAGPCIFRAASLLDTLFSTAAPGSSRDAAITDAFKWAAIATAAQVDIGQSQEDSESAESSRSQKRDFALASWRKAKELIFANVAATKSFRLALALHFFGNIVPPSGAPPHSQTDEDSEDRDYAFCEGIRRLQELCKQGRRHIMARKEVDQNSCSTGFSKGTDFQQMPDVVCELVLELIGALEWLISISTSVAIGVSYGKVCLSPIDVDRGEQAPTPGSPPHDDSTLGAANQDALALLRRPSHQESFEAPILRRARRGGVSFIDVWRSNIHDSDGVLYTGRLHIALSILTWRFLSRFTIAAEAVLSQSRYQNHEDVRRHYIAMISHVDLWRTSFGTVDQSIGPKLRNSHREVWRIFAFCSVDTDLAILLFCDLARKLEAELEGRPSLSAGDGGDLLGLLQSTKSYRSEQRLISASQTALVSSTCQGPTSSGTSLAQEPPTYGRYMCAHPNPWMLIQAHLLSVQTFSEEIKQPVIRGNAERVSELTWGMNTCFQGLRELREILCITPSINISGIT